VAEEQAGVAGGTEIADEDIFGLEACRQELRAIGFAEIEVDVLRRRLVARRFHVEPLERIGLFAGARLVEIIGSIGELRGKFRDEVGSNFVTARTNRRADGGQKISGLTAEFELHAADGLLGDSGESAAPAGMNGGNSALIRIYQEYRDAIGGLNGKEKAGTIRGGGIAFAKVGRQLGKNANHVRVDLLERDQFKIGGAEGGLKQAAIFEDVFAGVPFHEAEVKNFFGFERTNAAGAGAETVDEPGKLAKRGEFENLQTAGFAEMPGRSDTGDRRRKGRRLTRATPPQ